MSPGLMSPMLAFSSRSCNRSCTASEHELFARSLRDRHATLHSMTALSPIEAVGRYSTATSRSYGLLGPLAGGETGAMLIEGVDGERRVLKWESDPANQAGRCAAIPLAERLRTEAGWPIPRQEVVWDDAWLFVTQEFMDGEPIDRLSHGLVDELLRLHHRRLGLTVPDGADRWGEDMIAILVEGGNGYCLHQPLRDYDERTRHVVERIEEIGRALTPADLPGGSIVHGDLHPGNLLQVGGQLSAVVDLDYARLGDAAFDLACLALASLEQAAEAGVRQRLMVAGVAALGSAPRAAYVGNLLLRLLDWPIRKNRIDELEFWVEQADHLLDEAVSGL